MRISDWSSDVCSSDLWRRVRRRRGALGGPDVALLPERLQVPEPPRRALRRGRVARGIDDPGLAGQLRGPRALLRPLRVGRRGLRAGRQRAGSDPRGRKPLRRAPTAWLSAPAARHPPPRIAPPPTPPP